MKTVFSYPESLSRKVTHYCPGCPHGIIHRLIAECLDELGLREQTVGVCPVGCAVIANEYFNLDMLEAAHGRAPAVATAIKRLHPENFVFAYQGDGDLASIGMAEIMHASIRGENISVIFVNNAIYGMTGGQMAPTTLLQQVTTTSPYGRDAKSAGYPVRMAELLAVNEGSTYIARTSVDEPKQVVKTKKAIKKAFETQLQGRGFSMVEILSACPTNWGLDPLASLDFIREKMIPYYPLGEIKDKEAM